MKYEPEAGNGIIPGTKDRAELRQEKAVLVENVDKETGENGELPQLVEQRDLQTSYPFSFSYHQLAGSSKSAKKLAGEGYYTAWRVESVWAIFVASFKFPYLLTKKTKGKKGRFRHCQSNI